MAIQIAVVGGGAPPSPDLAAAVAIGEHLAHEGAILVCGGLGGVMEAACRGAKSAGGMTVGILPGSDPNDANPWVDIVIPTGLGEARNALVIGAVSAVIAIGGEYGTLSEIAFALRSRKVVIGLSTWSLIRPEGMADPGIIPAGEPGEAASMAVRLAEAAGR